MQAQDATTIYLLRLWPWLETNKNRIIGGAVIVVIAGSLIWYFLWQQEQKAIAAGQAITQLIINPGERTADAYFKIAADYPGTIAAQRALLQGAVTLFETGRYADAQTEFQKFLDAHPDNEFSGQAALGVAACLEAQNKTDLAASAYQRVINTGTDQAASSAAKFVLAQIYETQGRFNDALAYYQDVERENPGTPLGSEAGLRMMELQNKIPAPASTTTPAATPATPFKLTE